MFAAGAMKGYPEEAAEKPPVPDSPYKLFIDGDDKTITGAKFWFKNPGTSTSGTDWSQGWECTGEKLTTFTDAELTKKTAKAADVEAGIKKKCEEHAKTYDNTDKVFTCCMITKAASGDETHTFTAHKGSAMTWTGVSKSLMLPPK